jgi:hypothetical protein
MREVERGATIQQAAKIVLVALFILASVSASSESLAQSEEGSWTTPQNLSHSGAASQPGIVIAPNGNLRILWWDQFDGLMVADGRTKGTSGSWTWSEPKAMPILLAEKVQRDGQEKVVLAPIKAMPRIVGDATGTAHAFWLGQPDQETGARALMYSRLQANSSTWSSPISLSESTASLDVAADTSGAMHLAYLETQQTPGSIAGVYYRRTDDGGATWTPPALIYQSRYLRLLAPDAAWVRLAVDGSGGVYTTWDDPHLERSMLAYSSNSGTTWKPAQTVDSPRGRPQRARVVPASGGKALLLWEPESSAGACSLYQVAVADLLAGSPSVGQRVLEDLAACPGNEQFLPFGDGLELMVAGSGGDTLTLAAWDGEHWSAPRQIRFDFEDPDAGRQAYLSGLLVELISSPSDPGQGQAGTTVVTVGTDQTGDVWVTAGPAGALNLGSAAAPSWSDPAIFSDGLELPGLPALAADVGGRLHTLWSQMQSEDRIEEVLYYAQWDGERWTRPTQVLGSPEGGARQPSLATVGERLHAVWSGGLTGAIYYSRAFLDDAYTTNGWDEPRLLPAPVPAGSWPHIVASETGGLDVVYAVPVNEMRGIYLTSSTDGGQTWSAARQVFDAVGSGWAMVDYPRLAIDLGGVLHVVWVGRALSSTSPPQGIYYARSADGGQTWSEPLELVGVGYDWPQLAAGASGQVHLVWSGWDRTGPTWHRWSPDGGDTWSQPEWALGIRELVPPAGLVADSGGTAYLVGLGGDGTGEIALLYLRWRDGKWDEQETYPLDFVGGEPGAAAALVPALGRLDVAFRAQTQDVTGTLQVALWHSWRTVPVSDAMPLPASTAVPALTSVPAANLVPTPTLPAVPTEAAPLVAGPPAPGSSAGPSVPLLLSGALAALVVAGAFGARLLRKGHR